MKTLFNVPLLICVLLAIANSPCLGFVSFGEISEERAAEVEESGSNPSVDPAAAEQSKADAKEKAKPSSNKCAR